MLDQIRRSELVAVRLRPHERDVLERAARRSRKTTSEFVRDVVLGAAQRRVGKKA